MLESIGRLSSHVELLLFYKCPFNMAVVSQQQMISFPSFRLQHELDGKTQIVSSYRTFPPPSLAGEYKDNGDHNDVEREIKSLKLSEKLLSFFLMRNINN